MALKLGPLATPQHPAPSRLHLLFFDNSRRIYHKNKILSSVVGHHVTLQQRPILLAGPGWYGLHTSSKSPTQVQLSGKFSGYRLANPQESACKEITPDASSMFDVRCIDAVARSNHPNIVQVQDRWADQWPTPKVYIQMELCYGDLNQYIEATREAARTSGTPIDHRAVWKIVLQIVDGLTYAHELGWSHRNLKPRNSILLL
jgi:serine/threonine protein kinase